MSQRSGPRAVRLLLASVAVAAVFLAGAGPAPAAALTIGLPAYALGGNCLPFGCVEAHIDRYQQIYANTAFPVFSPQTIVELDFFMTNLVSNGGSGGYLNSGNYTLSLSTSAKKVGELDLGDFDANRGPDHTVVANAILGGGPAGSILSFFLGVPFVYDPTQGNLLLDIEMTNLGHPDCPRCFDTYFDLPTLSGGRLSRAFGNASGGAQDFNDALVTRFVFLPEPGTPALAGVALMACLLGRRARGRAA